MGTLLQDLKYGLRMLAKDPAFATVAIITLGLGIGVNSAIFSVLNSLMLRPLPVKDPDQLVVVASKDSRSRYPHSVSFPDYLDLQTEKRVFSGVLAYEPAPVNLSGEGVAERIWVDGVTANYFSVLGVDAMHGRTFLPEESGERVGQPVIVLSYSFWQRRYANDRSIVGRTVDLNNHPFLVVGITPETFAGADAIVKVDAYVPLTTLEQLPPGSGEALHQRDNRGFRVMARLRSGTSLDQARAEVKVLAHQLELEYPKTNEGVTFMVIPETRARPDPADASLLPQIAIMFMILVGLVLVIACANFAGLMLARATTRGKEMAIRAALGANRLRLARQVVTEGIVFGLLGGAAGLVLAGWATHLLSAIKLPTDVPVRLFTSSFDWRVLGFALAISVMTGVIASLVPAFRASRLDLNESLKEGARGGAETRSRNRLRSILVVSQIAVSTLLLLCSGLFIRSLKKAEEMDFGFRTDHLLMLSVDVGMQGYDKGRAQSFYQGLVERVQRQPWTRSVSLARFVPFGNENATLDIFTEEHPPTSKEPPLSAFYNVVGLGYFTTVGTPLLRGRDFSEQDNDSSPKVTILSETTARLLWPGKDPIGKPIKLGRDGSYAQVIGVARDIKLTLPYTEAQPLVYFPLSQDQQLEITLLVHTAGDARAALGMARDQVRASDPALPAYDVKTMATHIRAGVALLPARLAATLVGAFGVLGLLLAVVGLYGVVSYFVAQRTHEIGIRMALGARRIEILKLVVRQGIVLTLGGVAVGMLAGFGVTPLVASVLYGVRPTDPLTFVLVSLLLITVALLASYIPARRASKVDPIVALRYE